MQFCIDEVSVFFPYPYIYPEQYRYMVDLKRSIASNSHCLLEMPTGTGKTVALLSLVTSYQLHYRDTGKLIYCTRTVPEMDKVMAELKFVIEKQTEFIRSNHQSNGSSAEPPILGGQDGLGILAVGLSARRNLCINPSVANAADRESVDNKCRKLTAPWIRESVRLENNIANSDKLCSYYETLDSLSKTSPASVTLPRGVYSLDDLREFGRQQGWCPYYLARRMINQANVIVYNYQYILDPKISSMVSNELSKESIVVFDEAHNIDSICIEVLSLNINRRVCVDAGRSLKVLNEKIKSEEKKTKDRLTDEYQRLVSGLRGVVASQNRHSDSDSDMLIHANPILPQDILDEAVPGNIRQARHFLGLMNNIVDYLRYRLGSKSVLTEEPIQFLVELKKKTGLDSKPLKFCSDRLSSLLRTLEIENIDEFSSLKIVADLSSLVATYNEGFKIIIDPLDQSSSHSNIPEPVLQFCCLDSSLAIRPVFQKFRSVVITSGTLSPLDLYPKLLNFIPGTSAAYDISLARPCIAPLVVSRGSDQSDIKDQSSIPSRHSRDYSVISSKYEFRENPAVIRNYGTLISELVAVIPDGMVVFFTSYRYMEDIITKWDEQGILKQIMENKLLFVETTDIYETSLALENYRKACDSGRGAVFFSIARGKIAEGIDFDRHYGRCVVMIGVPFQYTESQVLKCRLDYLQEKYEIKPGDFLTFDAMRQAAQCMGRVIRSKTDYGLMVLADSRYNMSDKRAKLPGWITHHLAESHLNLSIDLAVTAAKHFLRQMAQPLPKQLQLGITLWTLKDIEKYNSNSNKNEPAMMEM